MIEDLMNFDKYQHCFAVWCPADAEAGVLARCAEKTIESGADVVSVMPEAVNVVWPWLENKNVKIMGRFVLPDKKITEKQISDVTLQINKVLKNGADGAQVFIRYAALPDLVEQTFVIRDDLFFYKDLSIGLDMSEIAASEWADVFAHLRKINASSVLFVFAKGAKANADFVGRLYGMLKAWTDSNNFDLHFALGPNFMRIEQAIQMVEEVRPGLIPRMKFWVNN